MTAWEYKVLTLPAASSDVDEEILGIHGEKGWELVTLLVDKSGHRVCYFKRPAAPSRDVDERDEKTAVPMGE